VSDVVDESVAHKTPVQDFAADWDHTDPQWVNDPYPIWTTCANVAGRHTERYGGGWFPTTHEMVTSIAMTPSTSRAAWLSSRTTSSRRTSFPRRRRRAAITSDPPFHSIARRVILRPSPGPVNALEPQIRALCNKHLDEMVVVSSSTAGPTTPVHPAGVIATMLGFPSEDEEIFRDIVHLVLDLIDLPTEVRGPLFEPMGEYFAKQIDDHIEYPAMT